MLSSSIYMKCPEHANLRTQKVDEWLPWAGKGGWKEVQLSGAGVLVGAFNENVLEFIEMIDTQLFKYTKSY